MYKLLTILSLVAFTFQSCNKDDAGTDGFDFSNTLPPYVELTSTAPITLKQVNDTTFVFQMRTAMQQAVTVYYDVTGGGLNLINQTVVIDRNKLTAVAVLNIPNVIVPPATTATATLTLFKAQTADGKLLTIGSKNIPATQKVTINITL